MFRDCFVVEKPFSFALTLLPVPDACLDATTFTILCSVLNSRQTFDWRNERGCCGLASHLRRLSPEGLLRHQVSSNFTDGKWSISNELPCSKWDRGGAGCAEETGCG